MCHFCFKFSFTIKNISVSVLYLLSFVLFPTFAVEKNNKKNAETAELYSPKLNLIATNTSKNAPIIIESQVKGSQEQPKVIYIMPWQGIENPIIIEGNKQKIILPSFQPINPSVFKKQAVRFYNLKTKNKKTTFNNE